MGNCCAKDKQTNKALDTSEEDLTFEQYDAKKDAEQQDSREHITYRLIFMRCGETDSSKKKKFSGWLDNQDTRLTKDGRNQAVEAGNAIKNTGYTVNIAYTSMLTRAEISCKSLLKTAGLTTVPIKKTWRLNEVNMGGLTGLNIKQAYDLFGKDTLRNLRKSYDMKPPLIEKTHPFYEVLVSDKRKYNDLFSVVDTTAGESLQDCQDRSVSYWENEIVPSLKEGRNVLMVAHDGTLRCMMKYWFNTPADKIMDLRLPNCVLCCINFDAKMKPHKNIKFVGEASNVLARMQLAQNDLFESIPEEKKKMSIPISMTKTKGGKHYQGTFETPSKNIAGKKGDDYRTRNANDKRKMGGRIKMKGKLH